MHLYATSRASISQQRLGVEWEGEVSKEKEAEDIFYFLWVFVAQSERGTVLWKCLNCWSVSLMAPSKDLAVRSFISDSFVIVSTVFLTCYILFIVYEHGRVWNRETDRWGRGGEGRKRERMQTTAHIWRSWNIRERVLSFWPWALKIQLHVRLGSRCLRSPLVGGLFWPSFWESENLLTTTRIFFASGSICITALRKLLLTVHRTLAVECIGKRNPGWISIARTLQYRPLWYMAT